MQEKAGALTNKCFNCFEEISPAKHKKQKTIFIWCQTLKTFLMKLVLMYLKKVRKLLQIHKIEQTFRFVQEIREKKQQKTVGKKSPAANLRFILVKIDENGHMFMCLLLICQLVKNKEHPHSSCVDIFASQRKKSNVH